MAQPASRSPGGSAPAIAALAERFGPRLSTNPAEREHHAAVEGLHAPILPDAVLKARATTEVAEAVRLCAAHGLPVIPYGAGSSLEGHVLAPRGGLCLDLSEMNAVLEVNADDLDARVEAGVTRKQLNLALRDLGLMFPVDPGADATLGGMASTRASGTTTVRYGGMSANVLGLTVVLASGEVIRTGGRARKSSAGYDLTSLFVGAEGTLGVITEVQLCLHGVPEEVAAATCAFDTVEGAVDTVIQAVQSGLAGARMEFLDALQMRAVNAYAKSAHPELPTLFLEFAGPKAAVVEHVAAFAELAQANGGGTFHWAQQAEDRNRLWDARHKAYFAGLALAPGKKAVITDVCVPVSRLAEVLVSTRADLDATGLVAPIVGHVGDGNFHALLLVDPDDPGEVARAKAASGRMVERALAAGGTCTGEHGIGLGKKAYLLAEHGPAVAAMRAVKAALDPLGLMNPDKIFDL